MDQRKVMSLGRSSLVVSLPRHWVKLNNLKKGDTVSLGVQRDRSLVVFQSTERREDTKMITLNVDPNEKGTSIARRVTACYLNGFSSIKLSSNKIFSTIQQKAIREIAGKIYMRIMESNANTTVITTLIDESKASPVSGIHRMHLISSSMCRDAFNSLKNKDVELAKTVYALDDDVDRFYFFLLRLLRRCVCDTALANQLQLNPIDYLDYQTVVHRIERLADHAANIAKKVIMLGGQQQNLPESILNLIYKSGNEALESLNKAIEAFFSKDITHCDEVIKELIRIESVDQEIGSMVYSTTELDHMIIGATTSIRDSIKRIADVASDIAEVTITRFYVR